mgnify:CR=1 FL=1
MSQVFVGNLSEMAGSDEMTEMFEKHGRVLNVSIKRGFGFVEFDSDKGAQDAIRYLDGEYLRGKRIRVEPQGQSSRRNNGSSYGGRGGYGGGGRRGGGPFTRTGNRVIVDNLADSTAWQELKDHMKRAGGVVFAEICRDKEGRYGVVDFRSSEDRNYAIKEMDGTKLEGNRIHVQAQPSEALRSQSRSRSRSRSPRRRSRSRSFGRRRDFDRRRSNQFRRPQRSDYSVEVANIPRDCSWQDLKDYMRSAGEVMFTDVKEGHDGKKMGIVDFKSKRDMKEAIQKLDGTQMDGQSITITEINRGGSRSRSLSRSASRSRSPSPKHKKRSRSRSMSHEHDQSKKSRRRSPSRSKSPRRSRSRSRSRTPPRHKSHSKSRSRSH